MPEIGAVDKLLRKFLGSCVWCSSKRTRVAEHVSRGKGVRVATIDRTRAGSEPKVEIRSVDEVQAGDVRVRRTADGAIPGVVSISRVVSRASVARQAHVIAAEHVRPAS